MKEKNLCSKTRPVSDPYEVWQSLDGTWTWKVLKKWQAPANEAANPYSRWFCAVSSPFTYDGYDLGDTYVTDVKQNAIRIK